MELLSPYKALDLTDEKGYFCGKILGDLGADVIKVEPPGGDLGRRIGAFYHDIPHPEKSLFWFAYNNNKRGITLNLENADGKEIFKRLIERADFVIESYRPGYMDELGLGYQVLSKINPRIIMTSITPFGQDGPYSNYKAPDIVIMAMGGSMYVSGNPDRPPIRLSIPQSYMHGGAEAAAASLIAHYYREETGEGQWIDVSMQQCIVWTLMDVTLHWDLAKKIRQRAGQFMYRPATGTYQRYIWPCKDGYIAFIIYGGERAPDQRRMVEWMDEEGMAPDFLKEMDWGTFDYHKATQAETDRLAEPISKFFLSHTKEELYVQAINRNLMLYPVHSPKDILENPQLEARNFWVELEHPDLGASIKYPGAFVKASETPLVMRRRAPLIGEYNEEVFVKELGFSSQELSLLKQGGVI